MNTNSKKLLSKSVFLCLTFAGICLLFTGCRAGYVPNNSFAGTLPGLIFSETTHPSYIGEKMTSVKDVEILGEAYGESSAADILLICSLGDCGVAAAKAQALSKHTGADDILNMEVDTKYRSVLSVFNVVTTVVRGKAIKYKK